MFAGITNDFKMDIIKDNISFASPHEIYCSAEVPRISCKQPVRRTTDNKVSRWKKGTVLGKRHISIEGSR